jgi:transcriptional antiterminator NusG
MIVRITAGPFSEYTGKVDFIDEDKEMLKVLIPLFGRDTPIEIEFGQVEKVS